MDRNLIIVVVLVVLALVAAVQAIQLNELKNNLATGKVSVASNAPSKGNTQASSQGLDELPSMVGGC